MLGGCSEPAEDAAETPVPASAEAPEVDIAAEFAAMSGAEDVGAEAWFALTLKARSAGDLATARAALDLVGDAISPLRVAVERARIQVVGGDNAAAVATLQSMFDNGFTSVQFITDDDVLGTLAGDAAFDALIVAMSKQAFPCEHDSRFSEFDFWIGEWDVHTASGQFAGSNRIAREESGCVLTEHWVSAGGTGSSVNFVDKISDEWVQVWNSQAGAQINIRGGLTAEGMRLTGTIHYVANGTTAPFRGLWTALPDGRVRQYFEQSNDEGQTWAPWFEGFYTRKSGSTAR